MNTRQKYVQAVDFTASIIHTICTHRYDTMTFFFVCVVNFLFYVISWQLRGGICRSCRYYKKRKWSSQLHHHQQNEQSLHTPLNSKRTRHMILESQVMFWDRYTHVENPILSFLKTVLQWLITFEVESLYTGANKTVLTPPSFIERSQERGS